MRSHVMPIQKQARGVFSGLSPMSYLRPRYCPKNSNHVIDNQKPPRMKVREA